MLLFKPPARALLGIFNDNASYFEILAHSIGRIELLFGPEFLAQIQEHLDQRGKAISPASGSGFELYTDGNDQFPQGIPGL